VPSRTQCMCVRMCVPDLLTHLASYRMRIKSDIRKAASLLLRSHEANDEQREANDERCEANGLDVWQTLVLIRSKILPNRYYYLQLFIHSWLPLLAYLPLQRKCCQSDLIGPMKERAILLSLITHQPRLTRANAGNVNERAWSFSQVKWEENLIPRFQVAGSCAGASLLSVTTLPDCYKSILHMIFLRIRYPRQFLFHENVTTDFEPALMTCAILDMLITNTNNWYNVDIGRFYEIDATTSLASSRKYHQICHPAGKDSHFF